MALLQAGSRKFAIELAIFDKDGTLFDFRAMWARIFQMQLRSLETRIGGHAGVLADIFTTMGYDPLRDVVDPTGPLALATYDEIGTILALALYKHGWSWSEATVLVEDIMNPAEWPPLQQLVRPIDDPARLFGALRGAGAHVGIVTTDQREMTYTMLAMIGAEKHVSGMVCADDALPLKPAPDGILHLCGDLGVDPACAVMVGDSPTDMQAGRSAGLGGCIAVLSGVSRRATLEPLSDVVIASIAELRVEPASQ